jgi:ribonuclease PH
MMRSYGRKQDELRPLQAELGFIEYPEGSVLFSMGGTRVLCNASIEKGVPAWMQKKGIPGGWITAEYSMLPRATHTRSAREISRPRARSQEIRRLIGRSLRAAFKLENLPEITCIVDCDVLQADGGTRTASISGGYMALALALSRHSPAMDGSTDIFLPAVAAVSAGVVDSESLVDLDYKEDSAADFDLNVVSNSLGSLVEVQGTAEAGLISREDFVDLLALAEGALSQILAFQSENLTSAGVNLSGDVWGEASKASLK